MHMSAEERFWTAVDKEVEAPCWAWTRALNPRGYGVFGWQGRSVHAHRVSMLIAGYEIPPGMVVDHICKNRKCVNPLHLRVTDYYTNSVLNSDGPVGQNARKTHCVRGHPLSGDNLRADNKQRGWRVCLTCERERSRRRLMSADYRERKNAQRRRPVTTTKDNQTMTERQRAYKIRRLNAKLARLEAERREIVMDLLPLENAESWSMGFVVPLRGVQLVTAMDARKAAEARKAAA